jgi:hypothetical protein
MNQDNEISHLLDLMPASGRMMTRIVSKPESTKVIFPCPGKEGSDQFKLILTSGGNYQDPNGI